MSNLHRKLLSKGPTLRQIQRLDFERATAFLRKGSNVKRLWSVLGPILEAGSTHNFEATHFASAYLIVAFSSMYEDRPLVEFASRFLTEFEAFLVSDAHESDMACSTALNYYDYFMLWRQAQVEARSSFLERELRELAAMPPSASLLIRLSENLAQLLVVVGDERVTELLGELRLSA